MWIGIVTQPFGDRSNVRKVLGPFDTRAQAATETENAIDYPGYRGFVFQADEVIPDLIPCDECKGKGYNWVIVNREENRQIKEACSNCKATGRVPRNTLVMV